MLTTECSFCKKKNVPGTRFCAECGSPMHLKVCPNAACGKVSDAKATICASCGKTFPAIDLVPPGTPAPPERRTDRAPGAPVTQLKRANDKPPIKALPLIMVAIVAGGLPLLWANRAYLPLPKTWQVGTSAPTTPTKPVAIPAPAPTPAPLPVAKELPAQATPVPETAAPVANEAAAAAAASGEESPAKAKTKTRAEKKAQARPSGEPKESGPCTEAKSALGLCTPGAPGK